MSLGYLCEGGRGGVAQSKRKEGGGKRRMKRWKEKGGEEGERRNDKKRKAYGDLEDDGMSLMRDRHYKLFVEFWFCLVSSYTFVFV